MDETDEKILKDYSSKRQRPRLLQNRELILGLHGLGATLKEIADTLNEKKQISVPQCTLSRFINRQEQSPPKRPNPKTPEKMALDEAAPLTATTTTAISSAVKPATRDEEAWRKIEELRNRPSQQDPTEKPFDYDPTKPLTLVREKEKT